MSTIQFALILFLMSAIACAWFAASRNRNQAGWFLLGCLIGPLAVLLLLLLHARPATQPKASVAGTIAGAVFVLLIAMALAAGAAEFWERYQEGERYTVLDDWSIYGDALLRFTKSNEHPKDAIVVKSAVNQIDDYESRLRIGMCWTMDDLEHASQGIRYSSGARGLLECGKRIATFQSPEWPAPVTMNTLEQQVRVEELSRRMSQFQDYLNQIHSARADSTTTLSTN